MRKGTNHPLFAVLTGVFAVVVACAPLARAHAQEAPDPRAAKERELRQLRERIGQASRRRASLERQRRNLEREAEEISARLVALAARVQAREALIGRDEKRIGKLREQEAALKTLLAMNRVATAELLAGLQKLRRDPPPPFVTGAGDVLAAVRGSMMLASAIPLISARAARLRENLERLVSVRRELLARRKERRRNLERLREASREMNALLARKRKLVEQAGGRLKAENDRLMALTGKARNLNELIIALRKEERRRREAAARRRAQEARRKREQAALAKEKPEKEKAAPPANAREKPSSPPGPRVAFSALKGRLPWPVQGRRLVGYGERTGLDTRSRGVYVQTRPGAAVIAPADARVELARPFLSYGELLILDAGGGYRILLAGLGKTSALAGQTVRAGEPVGEMGDAPAPATLTGGRVERNRPILYMELRKNGRPVDVTPWWPGARKEARRK